MVTAHNQKPDGLGVVLVEITAPIVFEWCLNPSNTAKLVDMPKDYNGGDSAELMMARWVLKMGDINPLYTQAKAKGYGGSIKDFEVNLICVFVAINGVRDSFENERNRYVDIYAMSNIRPLINEYLDLEHEIKGV